MVSLDYVWHHFSCFCVFLEDWHLNFVYHFFFGRVKSLSKGNNTKKDPFVNSSVRESTTLPFSSSLPTVCSYDGNNNAEIATEANRYGLSKQVDEENSLLFNTNCVPSRREDRRVGVSAVP